MIILLTGGSACGKSTYAETFISSIPGPRYYIAAMKPFGEESERKIKRHREMRDQKGFTTIERYTDMENLILPERGAVLLECLCNLTANEMFDEGGAGKKDTADAVIRGIENLARQCDTLVVVTNETGAGFDTYGDLTPLYIEVLGEINRRAAAISDRVIELVCGIPLPVKGELP